MDSMARLAGVIGAVILFAASVAPSVTHAQRASGYHVVLKVTKSGRT